MLKLTPSRVRDYQVCGMRYKLLHVDQVRPLAPIEGPHLALGGSLHAALKAYYRLPPAQARHADPATLLRQAWVQGRWAGPEEEAEYFEEAVAMLAQYVEVVGRDEGSAHQTEVMLTQRATVAGEAVQLRGRIDRLERRRDGTVTVVDYKTSASGAIPSPTRLAGDLPTYLYHELATATFRTAPRVVVAQLNLRTLAETRVEYDSAQRAANAMALAGLVQSINQGDFAARAGSGCGTCPARWHCPYFRAVG